MNITIITGNLGKDPDMHYTDQGTAVTKFSVAVTDYVGGKEKTTWFPVVVFGTVAENCDKYLGKGSKVGVEGRIDISSYEKDSIKRTYTSLIASRVEFLSPKSKPETVDGKYVADDGNFSDEELDDMAKAYERNKK